RNAEPLARFRLAGLVDLGRVIDWLTLDDAVADAAPTEWLRGGSAQAADLHATGAVDVELDRFPVEHAVCAGHGVPDADRTGGEDTMADRLIGEVHAVCRKCGQRRSASQ